MSKRTLCLLLCICLYASAFPAPQNDSDNITTPTSVDDVSETTELPQESPVESQENSSNPATDSDNPASDNQEDTESQEPDAGDQAGTEVQISSDSEQETNSENQVPNEEDQETVTENQAPNSENQESDTENEAPNAEGAENQGQDDGNQDSGTENQASDANQESSTDNEGSRVNNQEPGSESQAPDNDNQGSIEDDAMNPEEEVGTENDDEILVIGDNNAKDDGLSPPIDRTKFFVNGPFFPGPAPSLLGVTNAFGMHMRALSQDIGFETRVCHELLNRHFELVSGKCIMVPIFSPHNREFVAERKKKINGEKFICQELHINSVLGAIQEFCVSKKHWEFHTRDSGIYV